MYSFVLRGVSLVGIDSMLAGKIRGRIAVDWGESYELRTGMGGIDC